MNGYMSRKAILIFVTLFNRVSSYRSQILSSRVLVVLSAIGLNLVIAEIMRPEIPDYMQVCLNA